MAVILVKDFDSWKADKLSLQEGLKLIGMPPLREWKLERKALYAARSLDCCVCSLGEISAKRLEKKKPSWLIGVLSGEFIPVMTVSVEGGRVVETPLTDGALLEEIRLLWRAKLSRYTEFVSSREMSEYVDDVAVPKFKGSKVAKNTYVLEENSRLTAFVELVNSYSPVLFLLEMKETDPVEKKLRKRARELIRRWDSKARNEAGRLLETLLFLQEEGFDFGEEIEGLKALVASGRKKEEVAVER